MSFCLRTLLVVVIFLSGIARASGLELGMPDCIGQHVSTGGFAGSHADNPEHGDADASCTGGFCTCDCPLCKYSAHLTLLSPVLPEAQQSGLVIFTSIPPVSGLLLPDLLPLPRPPNS